MIDSHCHLADDAFVEDLDGVIGRARAREHAAGAELALRLGNPIAGRRIEVHATGIGAHAVQIAHSMGAQVTAVDHRIKEAVVRRLGAVVAEADAALAGLDESRLLEARRIQGFEETALTAIWESLTHLSGHTQEIIYVTRLQLGDEYRTFWTPSTPEQGTVP